MLNISVRESLEEFLRGIFEEKTKPKAKRPSKPAVASVDKVREAEEILRANELAKVTLIVDSLSRFSERHVNVWKEFLSNDWVVRGKTLSEACGILNLSVETVESIFAEMRAAFSVIEDEHVMCFLLFFDSLFDNRMPQKRAVTSGG